MGREGQIRSLGFLITIYPYIKFHLVAPYRNNKPADSILPAHFGYTLVA